MSRHVAKQRVQSFKLCVVLLQSLIPVSIGSQSCRATQACVESRARALESVMFQNHALHCSRHPENGNIKTPRGYWAAEHFELQCS
jgi:hypothetical protein